MLHVHRQSRSKSLLSSLFLGIVLSQSFWLHAQPCSTEELDARGATYLPVDNWAYPELDRLQALGYLGDGFLGLRPWTRLAIARLVRDAAIQADREQQEWLDITQQEHAQPGGAAGAEARTIIRVLNREFSPDLDTCEGRAEFDSAYERTLGITGTPLRDSFHLGQTIVNDYGRPYEAGVSQIAGGSGRAEWGRFSLYVRGEYQYAPTAAGYSPALFDLLSAIDQIPVASNPVQSTIPLGPIGSASQIRIEEASASFHLAGHEISFGKNDHWLGPAAGGSFAWSNNAENLYAFQIDRTEPLRIPIVYDAIGPMRYEFFVGSLQGHSAPNDPWVHAEKVSIKPTPNLEVGFERTVLWGGRGHEPITIHTFLRSFFSVENVTIAQKFSADDPGARFSAFDFSYRLPFVRNWLTLYSDSLAHDDVNPISAPRRAGIRPGLYLAHIPRLPKVDLRGEGVTTDPPTSRSTAGQFLMAEAVQQQGLTNKGFLFSDPIGREAKGGNAWLTYHLSPGEQVQASWRMVKAAKDFLPGGITQQQFRVEGVKRYGREHEIEARAWVQYEQWKAPIYRPGSQDDLSAAGQLTWYPHKVLHF